MRRHLLAILVCLFAPGCLIVQTGVTNPVPGMSTVAVAPFFNLSGERAVDGRRFASAYFTELQKVPGFQVVPLGVTESAIIENGLSMDNPSDVLQLAAILGVDAVVVGAVTEYDPYYPPKIGLHVSWFSPEPWVFHPGVQVDPDARKRLKKHQEAWREREREMQKQAREAARAQRHQGSAAPCETCPTPVTTGPAAPVIRGQSDPLPRVSANGVDSTALAQVTFPDYGGEPAAISNPALSGPQFARFGPAAILVPEAGAPPQTSAMPAVQVLRFTSPVVANPVSLPRVESSSSTPAVTAQLTAPDVPPPEQVEEPAPLPSTPPAPTEAPAAELEQAPPPVPREVPVPARAAPPVVLEPLPGLSPEPFVPTDPLMSYTRMFDGTDYELTALLRDYCELNGDLRSGGWQAYLHRTDDFIKFASHRMIVEMLTLHGGEGKKRVVFKLRKYR